MNGKAFFLGLLLVASPVTAQVIKTLAIAGVVLEHQGSGQREERARGVKVALYQTKTGTQPLVDDVTQETGVYNLVFHNILNTGKLYVRYEGQKFSPAVVEVPLPSVGQGICYSRPRDLVLRPRQPLPGELAEHVAAFADAVSIDNELGLLGSTKANQSVAEEIAKVAKHLPPSGSLALYEEARQHAEVAVTRLGIFQRDQFLDAARGNWSSSRSSILAGVSFRDPGDDDFGPGQYVYPADNAYKKGSFDLRGVDIFADPEKVKIEATFNATLEDPWGLGAGFSTQLVFVFIDTDGKEGSGFTTGVPGLNIQFSPSDGWDRLVILSPVPKGRVLDEIRELSAEMQRAIVVPDRTRGNGRTISATVDRSALGGGDLASWGYQVVVQSYEAFPEAGDLLTRKVTEFQGQHRFGGGTDYDCDPKAIDILAGEATGELPEIKDQVQALSYECNPDGSSRKTAVLKMIRKSPAQTG